MSFWITLCLVYLLLSGKSSLYVPAKVELLINKGGLYMDFQEAKKVIESKGYIDIEYKNRAVMIE